MLAAAGFENIESNGPIRPPGHSVHEMGTARMGRDPATSVLNRYNQAHDVSNLFVTDGSCMASSGTVNPSLTYMALSARAANHAADLLGIRRNLSACRAAAARSQRPLAGAAAGRTRTLSSRYPGTSSRRVGSISASAKRMRAAQAEDSATTVIRSAIEGAAIYLNRELRSQGVHYCDVPLGRLRRLPVHAQPVLAGVPRLSRRPTSGGTPGGPFACLGGVFWA